MNRRAPTKPALWLALRIPHLPLEVYGHSYNSATPVIISHKRKVYHCNALALAEGVTREMTLSTAQTLCTGAVLEREAEAELQALQQLAEVCYQFTPYIEFHLEQGLLLEVSRSLMLFHGLESLVQRLRIALDALPYHCHFGLAHTGKAAWLLSWQNHAICGRDDRLVFLARLRQVAVDQLTEHPNAAAALKKSGFQTLGDILTQLNGDQTFSYAAISKRFGHSFSQYLEELFGGDSHPQGQQNLLFSRPPKTFTPDERFQEHIQFDYPVSNTEQLHDPMQQLLEKLIDKLVSEQLQCHSIEWRLYDIHQNRQDLTVNADRIHNQWQLPLDLTLIQLEHTDLPFEVDLLELVCNTTMPVAYSNQTLLGSTFSQNLGEDSERLFARLSARLGNASLSKLSYCDDPLPENCHQQISVTEVSETNLPPHHLNGPRPSWLFEPPQSIQQNQRQLYWHGILEILQGPERLQGHWWDSPAARDYFMAQRNDCLRCWIYQDLKSRRWYVHGVF